MKIRFAILAVVHRPFLFGFHMGLDGRNGQDGRHHFVFFRGVFVFRNGTHAGVTHSFFFLGGMVVQSRAPFGARVAKHASAHLGREEGGKFK